MRSTHRRALALIVVLLLGGMSGLPMNGSSPTDGDGGSRGPGPSDGTEVWTDPLDDMSHVYVPGAGLVGIEVVGGEARLAAGESDGWLASEIIPLMEGYRYDFVLLEATMPGESMVKISVLDATEEASEIGFANETIAPKYTRVNGTHLSVYDIAPGMYPEIRIQVDLIGDGADRPTLQAWTLYLVADDEWRDDFLGNWKMSDYRGVNLTGTELEGNLSRPSHGSADYDAFPPVFFSCQGVDYLSAFYPNPTRTGYEDEVEETGAAGNWATHFDDFNGDGHLDMVVSSYDSDTEIRWGDSTGSWSSTGAEKMNVNGAYQIDTGDFNNDGWLDLAFACTQGGNNKVFLNQGAGDFNYICDVDFGKMSYNVACGDLNNDGYDDVVFTTGGRLYYGGPSGPDTIEDVEFGTSGDTYDVTVAYLDDDEYLDVTFALSGRSPVFLGSA
ncbi:MAG: hypothetical protein GQ558_03115, partial [Thermoplasmata archaeon]|nr:hypothetical protein [Thermoplasmata archaeon]